MILRFLRLFRAFRESESALLEKREQIQDLGIEARLLRSELDAERQLLVQANANVASLQRENEYLRGKCDQWERDFKDSTEKRTQAVETVADFESMRLYNRQIFGRVPVSPPVKIAPDQLKQGRVHMRTVVQQQTADYERGMREMFLGKSGVAPAADAPVAINE